MLLLALTSAALAGEGGDEALIAAIRAAGVQVPGHLVVAPVGSPVDRDLADLFAGTDLAALPRQVISPAAPRASEVGLALKKLEDACVVVVEVASPDRWRWTENGRCTGRGVVDAPLPVQVAPFEPPAAEAVEPDEAEASAPTPPADLVDEVVALPDNTARVQRLREEVGAAAGTPRQAAVGNALAVMERLEADGRSDPTVVRLYLRPALSNDPDLRGRALTAAQTRTDPPLEAVEEAECPACPPCPKVGRSAAARGVKPGQVRFGAFYGLGYFSQEATVDEEDYSVTTREVHSGFGTGVQGINFGYAFSDRVEGGTHLVATGSVTTKVVVEWEDDSGSTDSDESETKETWLYALPYLALNNKVGENAWLSPEVMVGFMKAGTSDESDNESTSRGTMLGVALSYRHFVLPEASIDLNAGYLRAGIHTEVEYEDGDDDDYRADGSNFYLFTGISFYVE